VPLAYTANLFTPLVLRSIFMTHKHLTLLTAFLIGTALFSGATSQSYAQQLPPRPIPTAVPEEKEEAVAEIIPARITGTLIDLRTNAPAAGIAVVVGDQTILTDANGNYNRSDLMPGTYQVVLSLSAEQGEAAQGSITIEVTSGETVIQHLGFRSLAPVAAQAPEVVVPSVLPQTGGSDFAMPGVIVSLLLIGAGYVLKRRR
jgi:LPXTG-motif cell wall-anchored protein